MTLYNDLGFFVLLAVFLILAVVIVWLYYDRRYYILALSLLFDILAMGRDLKHILFFFLYIGLELALIRGYLQIRLKKGRKGKIYGLFLFLSILPLILSKISGFLPLQLFQIIGISYLTFKSAQMIIEIYDGIITEINLFDTLLFLLFFPCITSGPIDRSRRFCEDLHREIPLPEYFEMVGEGIWKLVLGLMYKFVLSSLCYEGMVLLQEVQGLLPKIGYAYVYGFYLFFDFAGYSMMAVGTGMFLGIRTPANFDKPFLSRDIREFWDRWHITLSHWFRDFLFTRFVMQAMRHKWFKNRLQTASAGFIVNMLVMGFWHGLTPWYILYGLYHGVLLALNEVWQKKSKFYKKHKKDKWYQLASWAVTLNLVMFGFLLFSGTLF